MAGCTNNPPANGQAVDCTGLGNTGVIAPAGVTGVTVTIENNAVLDTFARPGNAGTQYYGVSVNDSSTVTNNGTIIQGAAQSSTNTGVNLNGSTAQFVNMGTVSLSNTTAANAYALYGVISTAPDGSTYSGVDVQNHGTISLSQSGNAVARGIYSGENIDSLNIDNFGTISVTKNGLNPTGTSSVSAIDSDDDTDTLTVTNHAHATMTATGGNTFTVGGRANDYTLNNSGTITDTGTLTVVKASLNNTPLGTTSSTTSAGGAAILIYGPGTATVTNTSTGTINGDVYLTDLSPISPNASQGGLDYTRDSTFTNAGTVNGAFYYGNGVHTLTNSGMITGAITVDQTVPVSPGRTRNNVTTPAGTILPGGASFTLANTGTIGGDITITDRADSVNSLTLTGTGFSGNVIAVNGVGSNSLVLDGVTTLASVQNFSSLTLNRSNVTAAGGVSLVNNATLGTTIYGAGGTRAAPSTKLGTINGTLTLAGTTTIVPTFAVTAANGAVYRLASAVTGAGTSMINVQNNSALVTVTAETTSGKLLLVTAVKDTGTVPGMTHNGGKTISAVLNGAPTTLGAYIQSLPTNAAVVAAGNALSPITNGADVQAPINSVMLFNQQIDSRLDSFFYGQTPSSGRSADLGVARPAPVYGALPVSGGWIEGIGGGIHQGTAGAVGGYNAELEGVIGGYDRLILPNVRVGGAFGYVDARINESASVGSRETIATYQGIAYATLEQEKYYLRGSVGYGGVNFQSIRQVAFANFSDVALGRHSGNVFTARGEGGVPFEYDSALLVPYAAFTYSHLQQNGYTETSGNGAALNYLSAGNASERSEVGGKVVLPLTGAPVFSSLLPSGSVVALEGRAAYVHEFGNVAQTVSASFVSVGNVFVAAGPVPNRDMVDYGVGVRVGSGPVEVDISYNGLARSTYLQQVGLLRARYMF